MSNIFDYFNWRGDLTIDKDGFNNVDALILSRISSLPFDNIVPQEFDSSITIYEAANLMFSNDEYKKYIFWDRDVDLLKYAAFNPRFQNLKLSGYVNLIEQTQQMQFCAVTIELYKDIHFISFRGTDNSIVGWQEDFNMYYMFPLPSQKKSVEYLENAAKKLSGTFILGGHSKGGNLAVYSSAFCSPYVQQRIKDVFNHDGPGFAAEVIQKSCFEAVKNRVHTYVPQSSIFGMMLEHEEDFIIIQSNEKGFGQHDIYSWEIKRTNLVELNKMSNLSMFFDHTLRDFVANLNIEQRKEFITGLFSLLENTDGDTFDEFGENFVKNSSVIMKTIKNMDGKTRKMILSTLMDFVKCAKNNFSDINPLRKENRKQKKIPKKI